MGRVAPRKQASTAHIRSRLQGGDQGGDDSPSRQIAFEAAMGQGVPQEEPNEHVLATAMAHLDESQQKRARDKESTNILQRAAQKSRGSRNPNGPATVERKSPRKRKAEQALYDLPDSDNEEEGGRERRNPHEEEEEEDEKEEEDTAPTAPMVTRLAARKTASPEQSRSARKASATTKSPKEQPKLAKWPKRDDERLLWHLQEGTAIHLIHDEFDSRTLPEVKERMAHLYGLQQKERAEQEEAEAAVQEESGAVDEPPAVVEKGAPWSRKDVEFLLELWDDGFVPAFIQEKFPGRSWEAIQSRYYKANDARKKHKPIAPEKNNKSSSKRARLELPTQPDNPISPTNAATSKTSAKAAEPSTSTQLSTARGKGRPPKKTKTPEPETQSTPEPGPIGLESRATRGRSTATKTKGQEDSPGHLKAKPSTRSMGRTSASQHGAKQSNALSTTDTVPGTAEDPIQVVDSVEADVDGQEGAEDEEGEATTIGQPDENLWETDVEEKDDHGHDLTRRKITIPVELNLWGQRDATNKILQAALDHEHEHFELDFSRRRKNEDPPIRAIRYNKEKLITLLHQLPDAEELDEHRGKIDGVLHKLRGQVRALDIDKIKDGTAKKRFYRQVCIFITSDLLSILKAAIQAHAAIGAEDEEHKLWELTLLKTVTTTQVDLYNRTLRWKHTFGGIGRVKQEMLVPLRKVSETFERAWRRASQAQDAAARHQERLVASQSQQQQDDRAQHVRRIYDEKYNRLRALFLWRSAAAGVRYPASTKFRMFFKNQAEWEADIRADDDREVELDSDGLPIERVPLFGNRRPGSRPPRLHRLSIADQEEEEWSRREMVTLVNALRSLHGSEHLFKQLIDRFCRADGALRYRTLPELLRKTAELVDVHDRAVEQADIDDVEEAEARWPDFLRDVPDLDLIELLW